MERVSSEHWQQVKELFDAALERREDERAQFLDRTCAHDLALRKEIESLLESHEQAESFMESPAVEAAAESLVGDHDKLEAGRRVKHYEIIDLLGEGGMGAVYLAKDTSLGRRVAIKLLPHYLSGDPDRLRRFKQEARTASMLNHPNVCVIHEVGETDDGRPFIAMEYIEGATLRQRMNAGPMNLAELLDIAIQVAGAVTAAHEAGIVHRDIKPENIVIRCDGYVKVLDFGLAKLTESRRHGLTATISALLINSTPGMVMGTVGYMSPEQARGVAVDHRTDIWSLGVLLYELVCGHPPFEGATPTDIVVAIVEKEPTTISQHAGQIPSELQRIIRKSLRKDPDDRYQLAREMGIDLRTLRKELEIDSQRDPSIVQVVAGKAMSSVARDSQTPTAKEPALITSELSDAHPTTLGRLSLRRFHWPTRLALFTVALIVLASGFWLFKRLSKTEYSASETAHFQRINVTKLTTNGNALMAAISPDGKYLSYVLSEAGKQSLWLRQVAITSHVQLVPPRDGRYLGVAFSPDGNFLYYGYSDSDLNDAGAGYRIPVLGVGDAATKIDLENGPASVSHDGKRIAFIHYDRANSTDVLTVANPDGSGEQAISQRKWPQRFSWSWDSMPAWTAYDEALAVPLVNSDASGFYMTIFEVRLANRAERIVPLSSQRFAEPGDVELVPDGSGVMLSAEASGASFPQIWLLLRDGSARSITSDLSDYRGLSLRADGGAFATVQRQTLSRIWTLPKGEPAKAIEVTSGTSRYFDLCWAPDGKIVYASDASGSADIYEIGPDGTTARQLTSDMKRNYAPTVSPDGRYIAFHSNRSGIFQIWRMDRDGANPKQLTFGNSESNWPVFSADGKWILYQHFESGVPGTTWRVPTDGGSATKVTDGFAIRPAVSPDGQWIAYWQNDGQSNSRWRLAMSRPEGGAPVKTFAVAPTVQVQWDTTLRWTSDGRALTYVDHRGGIDNLWGQPIDGSSPKQLTAFKEGRIFSFDWAPNGNLVTSRGVITSDVVLISDVNR